MGAIQQLEIAVKSLDAIANLLEQGDIDPKTAADIIRKTLKNITD